MADTKEKVIETSTITVKGNLVTWNNGMYFICRDKLKWAICIYHSNEAMLRIVEYIHRLVPEHRLYI